MGSTPTIAASVRKAQPGSPPTTVDGLSTDCRRALRLWCHIRSARVSTSWGTQAMTVFGDRALRELSDPAALGALLAGEAGDSRVRTMLAAAYDLSAARIDQIS